LVNKGTNVGSRDVIGHVTIRLAVGGFLWVALTPTEYLARFPRYLAWSISGSWPWPFRVTWRHRSRDHNTRRGWFPIGGPLTPTLYLASLLRYYASS